MQKVFTVIVKTEDGTSLVDSQITGDFFSLSWAFSRLSHLLLHRAEEMLALKTERGSGIGPSQPPSSPPTGS